MKPLSVGMPIIQRRGVTLIELLVVTGLIVLLAALALPTVRSSIVAQKSNQATLMVQGLLESARAKAIGANRPVAAIIERSGEVLTDTELIMTSVRMSVGEVFPPYEGDWSSTTGTLVDTDGDGYPERLVIPLATAATLSEIVKEGDILEIGGRSFRFRIVPDPSKQPPNSPTEVWVNFENAAYKGSALLEERKWPMVTTSNQVSFRIYRKPSKTMTASTLMPRGTCIDLQMSGFGLNGMELGSSTGAPQAKRSIYIVFNPRGTVDVVYAFNQYANGTTDFVPYTSASSHLHLLIGKTDQVNVTSQNRVSSRDDLKSNLEDLANKWITINLRNGMIHSSDLAPDFTSVGTSRNYAVQALRRGN